LGNRITGEHVAIEIERQLREKGGSEEFIKKNGLEAKYYDPKAQQIYNLLSPELQKTIEEFTDRTWVFWENKTKHRLYTSDNPVVGYNHQNISFSAFELYFPLTPIFGISVLIKKEFPEWIKQDFNIVPLTNTEFLKFYNSLILANSYGQIFSCETDFRLAMKILKQTPDLSNQNRSRISTMK